MSDRFFLNSVIGSECNSGYLFDRSLYIRKILNDEFVQCAILSTYGFNIAHSQNELADLLGIDSKIPCLILHGDKRRVVGETSLLRKRRQYECQREKETVSQQEYERIARVSSTECCNDDVENLHVESDIGITKRIQRKSDSHDKHEADVNHLLGKVVRDKTDQNNPESLDQDLILEGLSTYPESVFVERIVPQWSSKYNPLIKKHSNSSSSSSSSSTGYSNSIRDNSSRGFMMGVHHPKYILLFTEKGLHTVISTSNMTPNVSAEGSWKDFFPRRTKVGDNDKHGSDFGIVLQDFLQKQSEQIFKPITKGSDGGKESHIFHDPLLFIKKYTGFENLSASYDFSLAQVDLVTSVPGCTPLASPTEEEISCLYALQRTTDTARKERMKQETKQQVKNDKRKNRINGKTRNKRENIDDEENDDDKVSVHEDYDFERSMFDDGNDDVFNGMNNDKIDDNDGKNMEKGMKYGAATHSTDSDLRNSISSLGSKCDRCISHYRRLGLNVESDIHQGQHAEVGIQAGVKIDDLGDNDKKGKVPTKFEKNNDLEGKNYKVLMENMISNGFEVVVKVLYGLQRCGEVLRRNYSLLPRTLTHRDTLLIQPTSISGGIKNSYIGYFLSHFMPEDSWHKTYQEHGVIPVECCRIIWPKSSFMRKCAALRKSQYVLSQSQNMSSQCKKDIDDAEDFHVTQCFESARDGVICTGNSNFNNQNSPNDVHNLDHIDDKDVRVLNSVPFSSQLLKSLNIVPISKLKFQNGRTSDLNGQSEVFHMHEKRGRREVVYSDDEAVENMHSLDEEEVGAGLYLQAKTLALMELDVQSRLYTYEPNNAQVIDCVKDISPHIKSYTRLMMPMSINALSSTICADVSNRDDFSTEKRVKEEKTIQGDREGVGKSNRMREEIKKVSKIKSEEQRQEKCICYALAWTLITSSCLSRGAHGKEVPHSLCTDCQHVRRGYVEILNFEIGVMFHSRPGKEYRALNPQCPLHSVSYDDRDGSRSSSDSSSGSEPLHNDHTVILPFPYDLLRGAPYCHNGKSAFSHRPYLSDTKAEVASYTTNQMDLPQETPRKSRHLSDIDRSTVADNSDNNSISHSGEINENSKNHIEEDVLIDKNRYNLIHNKKKSRIHVENENLQNELALTPLSKRNESFKTASMKKHKGGDVEESPCFATDFLC